MQLKKRVSNDQWLKPLNQEFAERIDNTQQQ